ncbi:hypothetical protein KUTeg_018997 [Tegillarca granosa]|uniref:Uncharacterized protein n=1 Tax=Tegillarca granosa TaxID=220873 RepID=A0ABQ9EB86_TEGGR|nr:hypothetical protein KUTeg_018997 [Tegillarca granosa]
MALQLLSNTIVDDVDRSGAVITKFKALFDQVIKKLFFNDGCIQHGFSSFLGNVALQVSLTVVRSSTCPKSVQLRFVNPEIFDTTLGVKDKKIVTLSSYNYFVTKPFRHVEWD